MKARRLLTLIRIMKTARLMILALPIIAALIGAGTIRINGINGPGPGGDPMPDDPVPI